MHEFTILCERSRRSGDISFVMTMCHAAVAAVADCASDYGNEKEVGKGIAAAMKELGIKREDLWITTKLWNTMHKAEHVRQACELQLKDLRLSMHCTGSFT